MVIVIGNGQGDTSSNPKDKGVYTFLRGINPKVNVIPLLEFELAYYDYPYPPSYRLNSTTAVLEECL